MKDNHLTLQEAMHRAVLSKDLANLGFKLEEDENFAYLYLKNKLVATHNAKKVTVEQLRTDAWTEIQKFRLRISEIRR